MIILRQLVIVTILLLGVSYAVMAQAQPVNCDNGQTITQALATAQPGDTLLVTGTCRERVQMTTAVKNSSSNYTLVLTIRSLSFIFSLRLI